ncbi:GerAB/ArcD/ProY family transporter [Gracilibacillus salitolerans]|uniref:GerAB/ArcD/ProY family transporter n=1 Tax=Gracilibacillus salitolerans TaxID=2663022 RepID=A0A5Q2TEU3_9BACI|nr:endospore germination permease [Gracilibacillus salitolerans]QGH33185.1 GerAB/ArcD/ProY family transporter [Gracilibacillus salitolerans]
MKRFEYADQKISDKQILVAVPSFVIGIGILSLPQSVASVSMASDGWISILIGGMIVLLITWSVAKLASSFPNQSFITYTSAIVTRPIAIVLTFLFAILSMSVTALQVRQIADIAKHYLLKETPVEIISFTFLLLIIYAVAGSRTGLFRLNTLFLPFVLFVALIVIAFNINWFDLGFLSPTFETSFSGYMEGVKNSVLSYAGFVILWFYITLVKEPKNTPKMAVLGMCIPIVLYLSLYLTCILVFGNSVTSNLQYPSIELAKIVEIPGGILERFESLFFVIWIMAIFNTTAMAFDIAVLALNTIFTNIGKINLIFIIAPIVYVTGMYPQDLVQVSIFGSFIGYSSVLYTVFVVILLFVIAKIRRVK